jgi:hypothetical protein
MAAEVLWVEAGEGGSLFHYPRHRDGIKSSGPDLATDRRAPPAVGDLEGTGPTELQELLPD